MRGHGLGDALPPRLAPAAGPSARLGHEVIGMRQNDDIGLPPLGKSHPIGPS